MCSYFLGVMVEIVTTKFRRAILRDVSLIVALSVARTVTRTLRVMLQVVLRVARADIWRHCICHCPAIAGTLREYNTRHFAGFRAG